MPAKLTLPTLGLRHKAFRYRKAAETDIAKTFARIKRERLEAERLAKSGQQLLPLSGEASTVVQMPIRITTT